MAHPNGSSHTTSDVLISADSHVLEPPDSRQPSYWACAGSVSPWTR